MAKPLSRVLTILVVDDSRAFRERVQRYLDDIAGIVLVGEAEDGVTALEAIDRLQPDVVLLDLHMPGVDGFHVLQEVRQRWACTAVIVLTSDASEMSRQRCAALRADAVIDKSDATTDVLPALRDLFPTYFV